MSTIDEAFFNAYADRLATVKPPLAQSNFTVRAPGATLRVITHATDLEHSEHRIDQPRDGVSSLRPAHVAEKFSTAYAKIATQQQSECVEPIELTLPSLVGERKPLSSYAAPQAVPSAAFKPAFEVDELRWPEITDELCAGSHNLFAPVVRLLLTAANEGRTLVGVGGAAVGVGASTVAICLTRALASSGLSVALVDGNFARGDLARTLGLEFGQGWEDVLAGKFPLAECAVASLGDKITLIPLGGSAEAEAERLKSIQASVIAGMLRYHHDIVLFDLGAASEPAQCSVARDIIEHCRLDTGIVVATVGASDPVTSHGIDQLRIAFGGTCLGIVGNRAA